MMYFVRLCESQFGTGCDLALRSAAILAVVSVVTLFLRRSSSAVRHLLWSSALAGVLLLPAISMLIPVRIAFPSSGAPTAEVERKPQFPVVKSEPTTSLQQLFAETELEDRLWLDDELSGQPFAEFPAAFESLGLHLHWRSWAVGAWLTGVIVLLVPLLVGGVSLCCLRRMSQPFSPQLADELQRLSREWLGGRRVAGLLSGKRTMPMTWGVLRPMVLLPVEATHWSVERRRVVLMHELAHIRRRDCLFQMIGQLVRALHWFNPLAWWSLSQLRLEQEMACDDAVLNAGAHADEYAAELLSVSARLPEFSWDAAVALAMSRITRLEHRLKAILNMQNKRHPLTKRSVTLSLTAICGLVFAIAVLQRQTVQGAPPAATGVSVAGQPAVQPAPAAKPTPGVVTVGKNIDKNTAAAIQQAPNTPADRLKAAAKTIESHSLISVNEKALNEAAIRGMLETLKDPYSTFITEDELKSLYQQLEGELVGIGAALKKGGTDPIVVELLFPNSPALLGGLKVGDVILAVNGQPANKLDETVKAIRGPAGTEVTLKILRDGKTESVLTLKRAQVRLSAVKGLSINEQGQWQHWLDAEQKLGYVQVTDFSNSTATDLKAILKTLTEQGLKGLVLDLRGNPGGKLNVVVDVARLFLKDSLIVEIRGRVDDQNGTFRAGSDVVHGDLPLVVLIDRHTASAGEVLAAALKDNDRATLVGERTFGKGSVQSIIPLDNAQGPAIKLTTAQMRTPKGRQLSRQPEAKEWGVDPQDGFYIPLTSEQRFARQS